jgi:hypothetical protein
MEVNQVLGIRLESLQVKETDVSLHLLLGDLVNGILIFMLAVISCRCRYSNARVYKLKSERAGKSPEFITQKIQ